MIYLFMYISDSCEQISNQGETQIQTRREHCFQTELQMSVYSVRIYCSCGEGTDFIAIAFLFSLLKGAAFCILRALKIISV